MKRGTDTLSTVTGIALLLALVLSLCVLLAGCSQCANHPDNTACIQEQW